MATMKDASRDAATTIRGIGRLIVGLYAWATAAYFGCVWLDILYAHEVAQPGAALGAVADLLLVAAAGMVLAGMVAIALAWTSRPVRGYLLGSLATAILMFPAPALLAAALDGSAQALGAPIRLVLAAVVSLLAFIGFGRFEADG